MAENLKTSLTLNLDAGAGGTSPQKWVVDRKGACVGSNYDFFTRCYRLYPVEAVAGTQVASDGILSFSGDTGQESMKEYLKFSNSDTASGSLPISELVYVDLNFAFDGEGNRIKDSEITFRHDPENYQIVASKPFYGAVHVHYISRYALYSYKPAVDVRRSGGYFAQYGNIISFFKNNITELEVSPPEWDESPVRLELYRVTSNILLNKHGNWETPLDWDNTPDGAKAWLNDADSPVKGGNGAENERVHEIGYFQEGTLIIHYDRAYVSYEAPKVGATWTPQYKFAWSQSLDAAQDDESLLDTLNSLNLEEVLSRVRDTYKGITGLVDFFTGKP